MYCITGSSLIEQVAGSYTTTRKDTKPNSASKTHRETHDLFHRDFADFLHWHRFFDRDDFVNWDLSRVYVSMCVCDVCVCVCSEYLCVRIRVRF